MPAVSIAQLRAMQAAKHGHSTLGIPQNVGADYVAATPSAKGLPERTNSVVKTSGNPTTEAVSTPDGNAAPTRGATMLEAMTGMSSGHKTRRGNGRHNAKQIGAADHGAIHNKLNIAMKKGDHVGAKRHALDLAGMLHRKSKGTSKALQEEMGERGADNEQTEPQIL